MGYVARLIVGRVEVVDTAFEACVHDGQILIRESHIDDHVGVMTSEQRYELLHRISIDRIGLHVFGPDLVHNGLAFRQGARCEHDLAEHLRILSALVGHYCTDAAGADDYYF